MRSNLGEREQCQASGGCQAAENAPASSRLSLFPFSAVVIADSLLRRGTKSLGGLTPSARQLGATVAGFRSCEVSNQDKTRLA